MKEENQAIIELAEVNQRLEHLNRVLKAIRNVNQLIVAEDDPQRLIDRACVNLTETMGYHNAWIALLGGEAGQELGLPEAGPVAATAAAGFDGGFEALLERLERGEFPKCMAQALASEDVFVVEDPAADCPDCPLSGHYGGRAGLVRCLEYDGVTWGILTASVPAPYARDAEEQGLFKEVAGDLAYALHKITAARKLEKTRQHMAFVIEGSGVGTWEWNVRTIETLFNEQWAAMLGYTIEELTPYDYTTWERLVHPEDLEPARQALADCVEGRTTDYNCEFRMKHKDGRWVRILDRGRIMTRDDAGKPLSMFGTHTDITDLRQTEETLRRQHAMLARTEALAHVGSWEWDIASDHVRWSDELYRIFRRDPGEGAPSFAQHTEIYLPEDMQRLKKAVERCVTQGTPYELDLRAMRSDGEIRHCVARGQAETDETGRIVRLAGSLQDLTEEKNLVRAIENQRNRLESLMQAIPAPVFFKDKDGRYLGCNPAFETLTGSTQAQITGRTVHEVWPEKYSSTYRDKDLELIETGGSQQYEFNLVDAQGKEQDVVFYKSAFEDQSGKIEGLVGVILDITDRKAVEESLARHLAFEQAISAVSTCLLSTEMSDTVVMGAMETIQEATGASRVYIFENFEDPDDGLCMRQTFEVCAAGVEPEIDNPVLQHVVYAQGFGRWCERLTKGEAIWGEVRTFPAEERAVLEPQGIVSMLVLPIVVGGRWWGFIGFDETLQPRAWQDAEVSLLKTAAEMLGTFFTRKQAMEALRESEEKFRGVFETSPIGIAVIDPETQGFLRANRSFLEIIGYSDEELVMLTVRDITHPEDWASEANLIESRLRGESADFKVEKRYIRKDGNVRWVYVTGDVLSVTDGHPIAVANVEDITDRKQTELALRESESRVRTKLNALLDPQGDIGTLHLADIVDCDEIQSLMNDFHALTDIGVGIIDLEGTVLVGTGWQDVCTKFHRVHPETEKLCRESDLELTSGVEPGTFKIYKCKNNMWDMVTPIVIGGKHLGNLFLGQFFFEDEAPDIAIFREQARRYGFDEEVYLKAYRAIPRWSRQKVDRVMTFYCNLINVISRLSYAHIKLARASESLRHSEQRFRSFVENANDIVYALSSDGLFTYISPNWLEFMGEPAEQAIGNSFEPYVHPDDVHLCRSFLEKTLTTGEKQSSVEYRVRHRDGSWRWHVSNGSPVRDESGTVTGYVGIGRDVTEAKQAEQDLIQSEKNYRDIFDNSSDCIFIHDAATGAIVGVNRTTSETFGYSAEEFKQLEGGDFFLNRPPYTSAEAVEWIRRARLEGPQRFEWLAKDRKGRLVWFENSLLHARISGEDRILVFGRNIDDRKHAEQELRRREELLNQAQEIAQLGSYVWSIGDDSLEWSKQMFAIAGIDPDSFCENLQETVLNLIHPDDRDGVFDHIRRMLEQKRTWTMEFRLVRPDGDVRWLRSISKFEYDGEGEPVLCIGVHHDITEQRKTEAAREKLQTQLNQAQKMESVGRLAGGVAHDFNNMLSVILGNTEMALEQMDPTQPLYAGLQEIQKAAEHSAHLTRQLLAFARKQTVAPKVIDLNKTVESMLKMLRRLIGEDIDLAWRPETKIWLVRMDPSQLDQILANLCVNARDAIAGIGKITIETGTVTFDSTYCAEHPGFVAGDFVLLAVSDDGSGMEPETLANLFEPFFTTKDVDKGTGLGLATVYGIVKQNDGFINVYSEPDQGTTFKIYLPRHQAKAAPQPEKGPDKPSDRGHETVLLVEDEPAILRMATMMLERTGYKVLAAGTPGEAIALAREHAGEIHLLMTDVVMPEMNGRDLANNLLSLYPNLKRLFMSGYTANVIAHHGVLDEGVQFIQKPFSREQLGAKVREALDEDNL